MTTQVLILVCIALWLAYKAGRLRGEQAAFGAMQLVTQQLVVEVVKQVVGRFQQVKTMQQMRELIGEIMRTQEVYTEFIKTELKKRGSRGHTE